MDSWLIEGVQLWADGRKVQAQDFSGSKADLGQVLQGAPKQSVNQGQRTAATLNIAVHNTRGHMNTPV